MLLHSQSDVAGPLCISVEDAALAILPTLMVEVGEQTFAQTLQLVLKRLGYVDKVVYYTIDFVPQRHPNPLINRLYHAIDHFCYFGADAVWNVSGRINEGRARGLYKTTERRNVHVVPIGVWLKEGAGDEVARAQNRLVFIGHLLVVKGHNFSFWSYVIFFERFLKFCMRYH